MKTLTCKFLFLGLLLLTYAGANAQVAETTDNEVPLADIFKQLGYTTNPGWTTLANTIDPKLQGEEVAAALFHKAGSGKVEMIPVARYSPDFELPFGYYTNTAHAPDLHPSGILAKSGTKKEHQTLHPGLASGASAFDPGTAVFGLYVNSADHAEYSEDVWNMALYPAKTGHAARIFPVKDKKGKLAANTYLVCFEDGVNGDYNDFVFLVKNVKPETANLFTTVFNGKDLTGFHTYLQKYGVNKDPDQNFRVEDGAVHVIGKDLGYAITDKSYTDFDLKVDFKWGVSKWPPREANKRDGGVLYNISSAEPDSIWPRSIEFQIQEGDVGDFWMLGFSTLRVDGKVNRPTNHIGVTKKKDNEKPYGEWNTIEVISYQGKCIQVVNGVVVNYGDNSSVKPGRFCLQSEYSEIYYKNVRIREL